ncbi:MAG: hypothetical protein AMXMBFR84_00780 [Candidatus Hydrogenedentota bacterium]
MSERTVTRINRIPYKRLGGKTLTIDLYLPDPMPQHPLPLMIIIHGGAWCVDNTGLQRYYAKSVAEAGLAAAAVVGFRLLPKEGFDGQIADIKDAIRWLRVNAGQYGFDPQRFGLYGSSSGSHLASLAAYTRNGDGFTDDPPGMSSAVQALFCLYGVYDFSGRVPLWVRPIMYPVYWFYTGEWFHENHPAFIRVSPIQYVSPESPKTLLVHGTLDGVTPLSKAYELADKLHNAGVEARVVEVPNGIHGFSETMPWTRPATRRLFLEFVREAFGGTDTAFRSVTSVRQEAGSVS